MAKALESRVALITGAASGIGLEIGKTFAREGAKKDESHFVGSLAGGTIRRTFGSSSGCQVRE